MYEEDKKSFNFKGFILKALFVILILILVVKLMPTREDKEETYSTTFEENMNLVKKTADEYITEDKVPASDGDSNTYFLEDLLNDGEIRVLRTDSGEMCNHEDSYIKVTKTDKGYKTEIYLECGSEKETLTITKSEDEIPTTTEKETTTTEKRPSTTSKTTTKKPPVSTTEYTTVTRTVVKETTTSSKVKVTIIYNDDEGRVENMMIERGNSVSVPPASSKVGYQFKGWHVNGSLFDFNTKLQTNTIIYAEWK